MVSSSRNIAAMSATPEQTGQGASAGAQAPDILAPLVFFYGIGNQRPQIVFVQPEAMPSVERHLLVHDTDMTPRLRRHHGCPIDLRVAAKAKLGNYLVRASVLHRSSDGQPVEFGAIGIHLDRLPQEAAAAVLEGREPFGAILERLAVDHSSHPSGWFHIAVDELMAGLLGAQAGERLFGRCNQLRSSNGEALAEVVEVLPSQDSV